MDIQMPLLDGYHATIKIREELKNFVPIIAMTANIMPHEKEKCLSYGMNDYLSKPFKEVDLYNMLISHLGNKVNTNTVKPPLNMGDLATTKARYKIINTNHLNSLSRGNTSFIKEIVTIFLEQNPIEIMELEKAIEFKDYDAIRSIAHKMKTSVGFIGLEQLLEPLNQIETLAIENSNIMGIQPLFEYIKTTCEEAVCELTSLIEETK